MWILTLLKNKWVIGGLITAVTAAVGGGYLWVQAQQSGFEKGFTRAEESYRGKVQEIVDGVIENRDEQWSTAMEQIRNEINAIVEQNERTEQQERELRERLDDIQDSLDESSERIRSAELGTCDLTDEFDGLFSPAGEGPATPGGTPSGDS
jgi:regulator of replication initiation timing